MKKVLFFLCLRVTQKALQLSVLFSFLSFSSVFLDGSTEDFFCVSWIVVVGTYDYDDPWTQWNKSKQSPPQNRVFTKIYQSFHRMNLVVFTITSIYSIWKRTRNSQNSKTVKFYVWHWPQYFTLNLYVSKVEYTSLEACLLF